MADRAQRVANFVCDASGEPPERCQFELLNLGGQPRRVLEHDQGARRKGVADQGEACAQVAAARGGAKVGSLHIRVPAPLHKLMRQGRRGLFERVMAHRDRHAEQHPGRFVHHLYDRLLVDHDDPGTHLLDHVVVQLREICQVRTTLMGQPLALGRAPAEAVRQQRQGEKRGPQHTGLRIGGVVEGMRKMRIDPLGQHCQRCQRCEQQRGAPNHAQATQCDRYRDQHPQARGHAAARMHHHRDQHDIDENRDLALGFGVADLAQVEEQTHHRDPDVEVHRDGEHMRQEGSERTASDAEIHQQQRDPECDPVDQVDAEVRTLVAPVGGHMRDVRSVQRPAHVHRAPSRSGIGGGDK